VLGRSHIGTARSVRRIVQLRTYITLDLLPKISTRDNLESPVIGRGFSDVAIAVMGAILLKKRQAFSNSYRIR
jgi:hypothetical protein